MCLITLAKKLIGENAEKINKTHHGIFTNEQALEEIAKGNFYSGLYEDYLFIKKELYLANLISDAHKPENYIILDQRKIIPGYYCWDEIAGLAFDSTPRHLFAVSRRALIWDLASNEPSSIELERDPLLRPGDTAVGFINNEKYAFAFLEGKVLIWEIKTRQLVKKVTLSSGQTPSFRGAAISEDKKFLVGNLGRKAYLFPLEGFFEKIMNSAEKEIEVAAKPFLIAEHSEDQVFVRRYSEDDSRFGYSLDLLLFSPYNSYVLTAGPAQTISVFDTKRNTVKQNLKLSSEDGAIDSAAFCPDQHHVLIGTHKGKIFLWNLESGLLTLFLSFYQLPDIEGYFPAAIQKISIHPSGNHILFISGYYVYLFDIHNKVLVPLNIKARHAQFSPDGESFFTTDTGGDGIICGITIPLMTLNTTS